MLEKNIRFFTAIYLYIKNIIKLFLLEAVLTKESIKRMMAYSVFLLFLGISLWFMILLVSVAGLHVWIGGWLLPLGIVTAVNLFIFMIVLLRIFSHAKNIGFTHTKKIIGLQHRGESYAYSSVKKSNKDVR